jgi:chromosome segregation ATPase
MAEADRGRIASSNVAELREALRYKDDTVNDLNASVAVLTKQLQEKTAVLQQVSETVVQATGAVGLSHVGIIDGEHLPTILNSVLQSKSSLLMQLSETNAKHEDRCKAFEQDLTTAEMKLDEQDRIITALEAECDGLKAEIDSMKRARADVAEQLAEAEADVDDKNAQIEALTREMNRLRESLDNVDARNAAAVSKYIKYVLSSDCSSLLGFQCGWLWRGFPATVRCLSVRMRCSHCAERLNERMVHWKRMCASWMTGISALWS